MNQQSAAPSTVRRTCVGRRTSLEPRSQRCWGQAPQLKFFALSQLSVDFNFFSGAGLNPSMLGRRNDSFRRRGGRRYLDFFTFTLNCDSAKFFGIVPDDIRQEPSLILATVITEPARAALVRFQPLVCRSARYRRAGCLCCAAPRSRSNWRNRPLSRCPEGVRFKELPHSGEPPHPFCHHLGIVGEDILFVSGVGMFSLKLLLDPSQMG